ncbi:MAG: hypothetical protein COB66_04145 [Coxiella sp. (in: Bacteria)]|nr:MAG: hypothetical protein COB66_04145 [Coxiella sp. (in: g-proteobacteria)]
MIQPQWPAPSNIHAFTTTRDGGVSLAPFDSFNLASHVNDNPDHVMANRQQLMQQHNLPRMPIWLNQTHTTYPVELAANSTTLSQECDAAYTRCADMPCTVLTADCLPLLVCNRQGTEVAAIHAGWRGLQAGVIENTIDQLTSSPDDLLVWLGPAIGPSAFEINNEIRLAFLARYPQNSVAFKQVNQCWFADIYALARVSLQSRGISQIFGGDYCTFSENEHFFSYRRDGLTGRMASIIWFH